MTSRQSDGTGQITDMLRDAARGNRDAFDRLLPHVYEALRGLAHGQLHLERPGHTLDTTALVHEAYLKLVDQDRVEWRSRSHFFAVAARAMRRILIDYARARSSAKRGGSAVHVPLDAADAQHSPALVVADQVAELLALNDALDRLSRFDPRGAAVVEYRFFGGMSYGEIAEVLGISEVTVRRAWAMAKTWLWRQLQ